MLRRNWASSIVLVALFTTLAALGADVSAWYAAGGIGVMLVLIGLVAWGFRASLGGRLVFSDSLLDD